MKQELIQKAKHLGFVSKFFNEKPYKHSSNEGIRYYLWLCELQKWIKDKHNIHLRITPFIGGGSGIDEVFEIEILDFYKDIKQIGFVYDTSEEALEVGVFESLILIEGNK